MLKMLGKSILSYSFTNKYLQLVSGMWKDVRLLLLLKVVLWRVNSFQSKWCACAAAGKASIWNRTGGEESALDPAPAEFRIPVSPFQSWLNWREIHPQEFNVCSEHVTGTGKQSRGRYRKPVESSNQRNQKCLKNIFAYRQNTSHRFSLQLKCGSFMKQVCVCVCWTRPSSLRIWTARFWL